jgi:hypothetical protein
MCVSVIRQHLGFIEGSNRFVNPGLGSIIVVTVPKVGGKMGSAFVDHPPE